MSEIHSSRQTEATAFFCPECHTPIEVTSSMLNPVDWVQCGACRWKGAPSQLAQSSFKHEFKNDDEIASTMMTDLRNLLAKTVSQSYGRFLLKWGFLDQPLSGLQLAHYIDAIARSVITTIIETRKKITEDKARERSGLSRPAGDEGR